MFKAPQKKLRSSWVHTAFTKSKQSKVVKTFKNSSPILIKNKGQMVSNKSIVNSNEY